VLLELPERVPGVAVLEVGIALVVEIVQQACQAPELDVTVEPRRIGPHRGFDGQHVPQQGF
jgi:hypothetical protein